MNYEEALADGVTLEEFFTRWVPKAYDDPRVEFSEVSDLPLILCFKFQDTDEVYSLEFSEDGIEVEDDEMVDFPMVTLIGWAKFWPTVRRHLLPLAQRLDARAEEVASKYRITRAFYDDFEKFDCVIDITVEGEAGEEPVSFSAVLNDYDAEPDARRFGFTTNLETLEALIAGDIEPVDAAKGLSIRGDYRAAASLGGMIMSHL